MLRRSIGAELPLESAVRAAKDTLVFRWVPTFKPFASKNAASQIKLPPCQVEQLACVVSTQGVLVPVGADKVSVIESAGFRAPRAIRRLNRTKFMQSVRRPAMPAQNSEGVGATERVNALLQQLGRKGPVNLLFSSFAL
eukprot:3888687-Amphidinium_carterae.1